MDLPNIFTSLLLTVLSLIGLVFFIRASVKDRTQQIKLVTSDSTETLLAKIQEYFASRAYQVTNLDRETNEVTFQGFVRASWFLAVFLSALAAFGLFCLALVLSFSYPSISNAVWGILLLAPIAGVFYYRNASRVEKVLLQIETIAETKNCLTVTAHRDELIQLQKTLSFDVAESK
ncbi:MAG: cofactor assembly of complex C subunit B [Xenococcaceae cyanobacterium]